MLPGMMQTLQKGRNVYKEDEQLNMVDTDTAAASDADSLQQQSIASRREVLLIGFDQVLRCGMALIL
jgi:hypothetical protein